MADVVNVENNLIEAGAAEDFGKAAAAIGADQDKDMQAVYLKWLGATAIALGTYKQYDMMQEQGRLFKQQKDALARSSAIADSNYWDLFKPQYEWYRDFLQKKVDPLAWSTITSVIKCLTTVCEYVKDTTIELRAKSKVPAIIAARQRLSRRTMKPSQSGVCCDDSYRYAELAASLMVQATSIAERYEDEKKMKWDTLYKAWQAQASTIAQNMYSFAGNGLSGAGNGISNAMSAMGNNNAYGLNLANGMAKVLDNKAEWWGSIGQLPAEYFGNRYGDKFDLIGGRERGMAAVGDSRGSAGGGSTATSVFNDMTGFTGSRVINGNEFRHYNNGSVIMNGAYGQTIFGG